MRERRATIRRLRSVLLIVAWLLLLGAPGMAQTNDSNDDRATVRQEGAARKNAPSTADGAQRSRLPFSGTDMALLVLTCGTAIGTITLLFMRRRGLASATIGGNQARNEDPGYVGAPRASSPRRSGRDALEPACALGQRHSEAAIGGSFERREPASDGRLDYVLLDVWGDRRRGEGNLSRLLTP